MADEQSLATRFGRQAGAEQLTPRCEEEAEVLRLHFSLVPCGTTVELLVDANLEFCQNQTKNLESVILMEVSLDINSGVDGHVSIDT